jgi:UDP-glucose 4-epimerase
LVLDAAVGRRTDVQIYGSDYPTPDGTAIRDYVHVTDLATAHVTAAEQLVAGRDSAAFNLGTGDGVSVRELIKAAERVTQRGITTIDAERRQGDPPALRANAALAKKELDWSPEHSGIEEILADAWRWSLRRFGAGNLKDRPLETKGVECSS